MIKTLNLKLVAMWEYKKNLKKFAKGYALKGVLDICNRGG